MAVQSKSSLKLLTRNGLVIGAVIASGVLLAACTSSTPATSTDDQAPGMTTEKSGDTTLSGKLVKAGDKYYLQLSGKPQQEVDSYGVDLSTYEGKMVTITGQFSGDTLFAGKVDVQ